MRTYATKNKKKKMKKNRPAVVWSRWKKLRRAYGLRNLNK